MEVRKLEKDNKTLDSLNQDTSEQTNSFRFWNNVIKKVRNSIKEWHVSDMERIKLLPPLNIVKCIDETPKQRWEITQPCQIASCSGYGFLDFNKKKVIWEDNESVSSSEDSGEEIDLTDFSSSTHIGQSCENITPIDALDVEVSLNKTASLVE